MERGMNTTLELAIGDDSGRQQKRRVFIIHSIAGS
jgi:hypothetical protein